MNIHIAKNFEEFEILPNIQANHITSYYFMDADRRHKTPGSEKKTQLLTLQQATWTSAYFQYLPLPLNSIRTVKWGQRAPACAEGFIQGERPRVRVYCFLSKQ